MSKRRSNTSSKAGDVRIIAGRFRGRRLPIVSVDGLRPTGDRVRETVFNWLQNEVPGARCLDAFAGTGALGFEAASRFAQSVTLVEANRQAAMALDQSKDLLQAGHLTIVNQRFEEFVASAPEPFDVVFVDPPFQHADFTAVLQAVDALLAVDGVVYLECPKSLPDSEALLPESWSTRRDKVFGDVRARLCERRS